MPAAQQPGVENEIATVGLPDLREGRVGLVFATIFCEPAGASNPKGYTNAEEARLQAIEQLTVTTLRNMTCLVCPRRILPLRYYLADIRVAPDLQLHQCRALAIP